MTQQQQRHKTDNKIGDEGARALSEALKVNTTLVTLSLACVQQQQDNAKQWHNNNNKDTKQGTGLVLKEHVH